MPSRKFPLPPQQAGTPAPPPVRAPPDNVRLYVLLASTRPGTVVTARAQVPYACACAPLPAWHGRNAGRRAPSVQSTGAASRQGRWRLARRQNRPARQPDTAARCAGENLGLARVLGTPASSFSSSASSSLFHSPPLSRASVHDGHEKS
ncbi:unnamed protein product [Prorocentrum cordatum]|uniref:Uncharacterized protein n=1 Tax=Prorocentrum cordatum TaxID=2364126 RepID=A0ABN9QBF8_9DINO|nr:unnamed protein product [Polarella glacialis]